MSTSIDRAIRHPDRLVEMQEVWEKNKGLATSVLWGPETEIPASEGLHIDDATNGLGTYTVPLDEQLRAPQLSMSLPIIQPIVWAGVTPTDERLNAQAVIDKHVIHAHGFVVRHSTSTFQGETDLELPRELTRNDGRRGFDSKRQEVYREHSLPQVSARPINLPRTLSQSAGKVPAFAISNMVTSAASSMRIQFLTSVAAKDSIP